MIRESAASPGERKEKFMWRAIVYTIFILIVANVVVIPLIKFPGHLGLLPAIGIAVSMRFIELMCKKGE